LSFARLDRRGSIAALAIAALMGLGLLWLAGRTTLWDRDEPRFAQATVEMVASGNYLLPTFNGKLRPDKPILIYWLMSLPVRWLGPTERAVRFWSPVGLVVTALSTFLLGRRTFHPRAGLWAMAVLATAPLAVAEGLAATTDAVLLAAVTTAAACFTAAVENGVGIAWWGLGLALGAALLTKGPVGLLLPALSMAGYLWLRSRDEELVARRGARNAALACLLGLALFLAWGVPASLASGGELARLGLGEHFVGRALGAMGSHSGLGRWAGPVYYLAVTWCGFLPWVSLLPAAISAALGGRLGGPRGRALLLAWGVPPFVVMSLSATQLPHYVLPAWPALALGVGATLQAAEQGRLAPADLRWLRRGAWLLAAPVLLLGGALTVGAIDPPALQAIAPPGLRLAATVAMTTMVVGGAVMLGFQLAGRTWSAVITGLTTAAVMATVLGFELAPAVERTKPAPILAAAVRAATRSTEPVATWAYGEPSLVFYLRRAPVRELAGGGEAAIWAAEPGEGILIVPRSVLQSLTGASWCPRCREIASARGWNISNGTPVELVALHRQPW
jgi:4-amino-4-deoxy-L-arabinose transferase-like glycosyltransferase